MADLVFDEHTLAQINDTSNLQSGGKRKKGSKKKPLRKRKDQRNTPVDQWLDL